MNVYGVWAVENSEWADTSITPALFVLIFIP